MAKRRLTEQQQRRIASNVRDNQQHGLPGQIVASYGKKFDVETEDGTVLTCRARQIPGGLVVGDWVTWQTKEQGSVIVSRQDRQTVLIRPDVYKQQKTVAANIDQIVVVAAMAPEPIPFYIDQYLLIAEWQNLPVQLLLNKADLGEQHADLVKQYQDIGYAVRVVSAKQPASLASWQATLAGKTSILVGQSGVGKSALLNTLMQETVALEGDISTANNKGKHTTTRSQLYHVPTGGNLIDSPGIREFGVWHVPLVDIAKGFVEFQPYIGQCQFRNCTHLPTEKGCAIAAACEQGKIAASRYHNYVRLMQRETP